jgi:hypothetical protein
MRRDAGEDAAAPKTHLESNPLVKKILDDFDGEIVHYNPRQ